MVKCIDWNDPCAKLDELRKRYYALVSGKGTQEVRYKDGNTERHVRFNNTSVDLSNLRDEIKQAELECNGTAAEIERPRYAMRLGSKRRRVW